MAQTRNAADPLSFMSLIPLLLSPVNRPATLRTREIEKDESAPPPNRGVMRPFVEARCGVPSTRPHGVALVLIYPCGKARNRPPFPSRFIVLGSVLAVKGTLRRFAPWPARTDPKDALLTRGKGGSAPWGAEAESLIQAHDKGYYHSCLGRTRRKEPFGHTSHLSRSRGALSPAGP